MKSFQQLTSYRRPYQISSSSSNNNNNPRFTSLGSSSSIKNTITNGFGIQQIQTLSGKSNTHTLLGQKTALPVSQFGAVNTSASNYIPPKTTGTPNNYSIQQSYVQSSKILSQKNDYLNVNGFHSGTNSSSNQYINNRINPSSSQGFKKVTQQPSFDQAAFKTRGHFGATNIRSSSVNNSKSLSSSNSNSYTTPVGYTKQQSQNFKPPGQFKDYQPHQHQQQQQQQQQQYQINHQQQQHHYLGSNSSISTCNTNQSLIMKKDQLIVIHVCDQAHKIKKDFKCQKNLLLSHMKYFEKYITNQAVLQDIDISVHCDINIFQWLMKYIHHKDKQLIFSGIGSSSGNSISGNSNSNKEQSLVSQNTCKEFQQNISQKGQKSQKSQNQSIPSSSSESNQKSSKTPKLQIGNVVSILISSDFLQMKELVYQCISYIRSHINQVVRLPIDLNCLNANLVKKLSQQFKAQDIDSIRDRKDKLTSKLYQRKLQELLKQDGNQFYLCAYCNKLYTDQQREWMICEKANIFIDFHGAVIAQHVADRTFDMQKFLMNMKNNGMSWRQIYWKIWGRLVSFDCVTCDYKFLASQFAHCSFHPQRPKFSYGSNNGYFPCCNSQAIRFYTSIKKHGCTAKLHKINIHQQNNPREYKVINQFIINKKHQNFQIMQKKFGLLHEPFINAKKQKISNQLVKSLLEESQKGQKHPITEPIILHQKLREFLRKGCKIQINEGEQDEDEDEKEQIQDQKFNNNTIYDSDDDLLSQSDQVCWLNMADHDNFQDDNPVSSTIQASSHVNKGSNKSKKQLHNKKLKLHKRSGAAKRIGYSQKVQKQWRMDDLRIMDTNTMSQLIQNLQVQRKSQKIGLKKKHSTLSPYTKQTIQSSSFLKTEASADRKLAAGSKKYKRKLA